MNIARQQRDHKNDMQNHGDRFHIGLGDGRLFIFRRSLKQNEKFGTIYTTQFFWQTLGIINRIV